MKIPLSTIFKNVGEVNKSSSEILEQLTTEEHFVKSKEELCFNILKFFDFPTEAIKIEDEHSIQWGCQQVLHMTGLDEEYLQAHKAKDEGVNYIDTFMEIFVGYRYPPGVVYDRLLATVESDLNTIQGYISKYEQEEFIRNNETPRGHAQRTTLDFYNRCIEERTKIQEYLANGLRNRALQKAVGTDGLGLIWQINEPFRDRPYRMPYPDSKKFFDSELIDNVSHRVLEMTISESRELVKKYKANKRLFYDELEVKLPLSNSLSFLISLVNYNPSIHPQRKLIFAELKELFEQRKWFAFYGLGLTQIEGLYGDMCIMCDPQYFNPKASLSDKVNFIQEYHPHSETQLDYFAFEVPNQRNVFLHKGVEVREDIDLLCKDVLLDLVESLRIFNGLDTEANWLHRLISKADITEFVTCKDFCYYFDLVKGVTDKGQYSLFEPRIKHLKEAVLPEFLYNLAFDLHNKFGSAWKKLKDTFVFNTTELEFVLDIDTVTNNEIQEKLPSIKDNVYEVTTWMNSEMEELLSMKQFIVQYQNYIDVSFLEEDVRKTFDLFKKEHLLDLAKIFQIAKIIGFEPSKS